MSRRGLRPVPPLKLIFCEPGSRPARLREARPPRGAMWAASSSCRGSQRPDSEGRIRGVALRLFLGATSRTIVVRLIDGFAAIAALLDMEQPTHLGQSCTEYVPGPSRR
jgi:hypothetical protein